jgi:hypothetical protein
VKILHCVALFSLLLLPLSEVWPPQHTVLCDLIGRLRSNNIIVAITFHFVSTSQTTLFVRTDILRVSILSRRKVKLQFVQVKVWFRSLVKMKQLHTKVSLPFIGGLRIISDTWFKQNKETRCIIHYEAGLMVIMTRNMRETRRGHSVFFQNKIQNVYIPLVLFETAEIRMFMK